MQHFAFALKTAVHDSIDKTLAELFLGRKILTSFDRLVLIPGKDCQFACTDVDKLVKEAQQKLGQSQKVQAKYYNRHVVLFM